MEKINFLSNKNNSHDRGSNQDVKRKKEEIEWSEPTKDKTGKHKKKRFSIFSLLKKGKPSLGGAEVQKQPGLDVQLKNKPNDKTKLKRSRQEILKLIKEQEGRQKNEKKLKQAEVRKVETILPRLKNFIEPKKGNKILLDYQQIFNEEEDRRKKTKVALPTEKAKSTPAVKRQAQEKHEEVKINKKSWLKKTINSWLLHFKQRKKLRQETEERKAREKITREARQKAEQEVHQKVGQEEEQQQKKEENIKKEKPEKTSILKTNLIKDEIVFFFDWRKNLIFLLTLVVITCFIIAAAYGGLVYWQKQKEEAGKVFVRKSAELESKIKQAKDNINEILTFQQKLTLVSLLIDRHTYWTNFFKFLEDYTINDVYYMEFSGGIKGSYSLSALAKNFNSISQQLKVMQGSNHVIKANVDSGQLSAGEKEGRSGGVKFNLELLINPAIFTE